MITSGGNRKPANGRFRELERRHWTTVALHQRTLALGVRSVNATEPSNTRDRNGNCAVELEDTFKATTVRRPL